MTIFPFTDLLMLPLLIIPGTADAVSVSLLPRASASAAQHPPTQNTHGGSNESQLRAAGAGPGPGIRAGKQPSRRLKFYNHGETL